MHCPRCGVEQTQSDECIACGIIFTKYVESLGRNRETIPPTGASPPPTTETTPGVTPVPQPFEQPASDASNEFTAQVPQGHSGQPVNPHITQPSGQHFGAAIDPFAPESVDPAGSSPQTNPFTQTQGQPAAPHSGTHTDPALGPSASDLDPFAVPISSEATPTAPDHNPFDQPATRRELPEVQTPTVDDPFGQSSTSNPTQPGLGSTYPPPSQTPTVETVENVGDTTQMDPLTQGTWEEQLAKVSDHQSGEISGNVHDLSTVPPEAYPVSNRAGASVSATGDANYQAMTGIEPAAPQQTQQQQQQQQQTAAPQQQQQQQQTAAPSTEHAPSPRSKFQRARPEEAQAIHPVAAAARVLGAIACLAIAVLMMVNGRGLMSVMPYVIMVAYGCAALWGLTTYKGKITVRQFAIEMCVLVAVTLTLRTASPEMFSVESGQDSTPVRAVIKPHLPKNALGRYTERALEVLTACDELAHPLPTTDSARIEALLEFADTASLIEHYGLLAPAEQRRVDGIERRVSVHAPTLTAAVIEHIKASGPDARFKPMGRKVLDAERELSAALLRAQGLRARILVVPDGATSESMRSTSD